MGEDFKGSTTDRSGEPLSTALVSALGRHRMDRLGWFSVGPLPN